MVRKQARIAALLSIFLLLFLPENGFAHGAGHLSPDEMASGLVVVGRYQFLLEKEETPPAKGKTSYITIRIFDTYENALIKGKKVLMAVKLPQAVFPSGQIPEPTPVQPSSSQHSSTGMAVDSPVFWIAEDNPDISDLQPAEETAEGGHYWLKFTPQTSGLHLVKLALFLDDKSPPLVIQFPFHVKNPAFTLTRIVFLTLFLLFFTGISLSALSLRRKYATLNPELGTLNLLDIPWVNWFFRWKYFPTIFQIPFLLLLILIIYVGLYDVQDGSKNLATILTWTVWWAGIIFTFVLIGRVWCLMCPVGGLVDWAGKLTRPRRLLPRLLRSLWIPTVLFLFLTWLDGAVGIVNNPRLTAYILLFILGLAILTSVFFARRTFCRYVCPIGGMIGLYSMFSAVQLRAKSSVICRSHSQKTCYQGSPDGEGCPMFEYPAVMSRNNYCNFCGECVKTCTPNNLVLEFRPFAKDLFSLSHLRFDEAFFAVALSGVSLVAVGHMLGFWHSWMLGISRFIGLERIGIFNEQTLTAIGFTITLFGVSVFLLPLLLYASVFLLQRFLHLEQKVSLTRLFTIFAYAFIPVGLSMHLAHNIQHLLTEGATLIPATQKIVNNYTPLNLGISNWQAYSFPHSSYITWLQIILVFIFLPFSLRILDIAYHRFQILVSKVRWAMAPLLFLILGLAWANLFLLQQDMSPRHTGKVKAASIQKPVSLSQRDGLMLSDVSSNYTFIKKNSKKG